eukprot:TRINITY_DN21612_c0_g1_i1.p1 TRINITY_DN21612_c0_g1~~TRINITY_DN21612_c0_g1_i1.p1  ORF type:complete len:925 (+),score=121.39 TRINITY_DN21612_c0_g1_i1:34-2775(+)
MQLCLCESTSGERHLVVWGKSNLVPNVQAPLRHPFIIPLPGTAHCWTRGKNDDIMVIADNKNAQICLFIVDNLGYHEVCCIDPACVSLMGCTSSFFMVVSCEASQDVLLIWRKGNQPCTVEGLPKRILALACGLKHTLVLGANSALFSFGAGEWGQLGLGTRRGQPIPQPVQLAGVTLIAAGDFHSVALVPSQDEDQIWAWGKNRHGQVGSPLASTVPLPQRVQHPHGVRVSQLCCGRSFSCAIVCSKSGTHEILSWGRNDKQQLGRVTNTLCDFIPMPVSLPTSFIPTQLSCATAHTIVSGHNEISSGVLLPVVPLLQGPHLCLYGWGESNNFQLGRSPRHGPWKHFSLLTSAQAIHLRCEQPPAALLFKAFRLALAQHLQLEIHTSTLQALLDLLSQCNSHTELTAREKKQDELLEMVENQWREAKNTRLQMGTKAGDDVQKAVSLWTHRTALARARAAQAEVVVAQASTAVICLKKEIVGTDQEIQHLEHRLVQLKEQRAHQAEGLSMAERQYGFTLLELEQHQAAQREAEAFLSEAEAAIEQLQTKAVALQGVEEQHLRGLTAVAEDWVRQRVQHLQSARRIIPDLEHQIRIATLLSRTEQLQEAMDTLAQVQARAAALELSVGRCVTRLQEVGVDLSSLLPSPPVQPDPVVPTPVLEAQHPAGGRRQEAPSYRAEPGARFIELVPKAPHSWAACVAALEDYARQRNLDAFWVLHLQEQREAQLLEVEDPELAECRALYWLYSANSWVFEHVNLALRLDSDSSLRILAPYIAGLLRRGAALPQPNGTRFHRRTKLTTEQLKKYQPGKRFVWPAFTSTSRAGPSSGAASFGPVLFLISVPAGLCRFAVDLQAVSEFADEDEVLLPPNMGFACTAVHCAPPGSTAVEVRGEVFPLCTAAIEVEAQYFCCAF